MFGTFLYILNSLEVTVPFVNGVVKKAKGTLPFIRHMSY